MAVALAQSSMDAMMQSLRRGPPRTLSTEALSDLADEFRGTISAPTLIPSAAQLASIGASDRLAAHASAPASTSAAGQDRGSARTANWPTAPSLPASAVAASSASMGPSAVAGAATGGDPADTGTSRGSPSRQSDAVPLAGLRGGGGSAARLEVLDSRSSPFASASSVSRNSLQNSTTGLMAFAGIDADMDMSSHILPAATLSDDNTLPTALVSVMPRDHPSSLSQPPSGLLNNRLARGLAASSGSLAATAAPAAAWSAPTLLSAPTVASRSLVPNPVECVQGSPQ